MTKAEFETVQLGEPVWVLPMGIRPPKGLALPAVVVGLPGCTVVGRAGVWDVGKEEVLVRPLVRNAQFYPHHYATLAVHDDPACGRWPWGEGNA